MLLPVGELTVPAKGNARGEAIVGSLIRIPVGLGFGVKRGSFSSS